MGKCYVKAYYDWIEQTAALEDAERGRLFVAILEYARSGTFPELSGGKRCCFPFSGQSSTGTTRKRK